jgi:hypothetical protein
LQQAAHRVFRAGRGDCLLQRVDLHIELLALPGQQSGGFLGFFGKTFVRLRAGGQLLDPMNALGRDQAELLEMAAQRIDAHGSLLDQ